MEAHTVTSQVGMNGGVVLLVARTHILRLGRLKAWLLPVYSVSPWHLAALLDGFFAQAR